MIGVTTWFKLGIRHDPQSWGLGIAAGLASAGAYLTTGHAPAAARASASPSAG